MVFYKHDEFNKLFSIFFIDDKKFLVPKLQDSAFRKVITSVIKFCVTIITVHTHKIVKFQNTKPTARKEGDKILKKIKTNDLKIKSPFIRAFDSIYL